jgi:hypothetical protein
MIAMVRLLSFKLRLLRGHVSSCPAYMVCSLKTPMPRKKSRHASRAWLEGGFDAYF